MIAIVKNAVQSKQIFALNGEKYVADELGQLIPLVEEVKVKEDPWQTVNTIKETCKVLKLGRNTLMDLINSGQLKAIKAGVKWLIPGWAIEEFIKVPNRS